MSAADQLCLDVDVEAISFPEEIDLADAVIAAYGGDARLAIRDLMLDAEFLRAQLAMAASMMSHGYGRGWRPKYERV